MPIPYLRGLSGKERRRSANLHLGYSLCFIAGAVNAGGFVAVGQYTSHMTGMVSAMADDVVLGNTGLAIAALAAVVAFLAGAAVTALLVNWARRRQLQSEFALCLMLEAILLLLFGLLGSVLAHFTYWLLPLTTMLLCFIMGLQNAIITKLSNAEIRTTHLTGMLTDIGIELGKLFYPNLDDQAVPVRANAAKLGLLSLLVSFFLLGAMLGALGFKWLGYAATIPLSIWLAVLACVPIWDDIMMHWQARRASRQD
ncbi:hypothetical protein CSQ89_16875 [Chitinimonas sp. BJB300]|nr:hypothetical protein CSQ89_16875 [Chitinimonas sp. BJB300]TSJ91697.1 DUF1275 domain-containing protein [Chitinimonas sp. BJB300]